MRFIQEILIILLLIFLPAGLMADEFIVKSFEKDPNNLNARKYQRLDDNDEACALILVRTSLTNLKFSVNTGAVGDIEFIRGEYWLYVSQGTRRISYFKEGFIKQDFNIEERLNSFDVYILELAYKLTAGGGIANTMGFILLESEPAGADVWIDGEATGMQTPFQQSYNEGFYRFTLKKDLFQDYISDFTIIANETTLIPTVLKSNFGSLHISTTPEKEASIVIDGKSYNKTTPATISNLIAGEHKLTIRKNMFEPVQQTVTVIAEDTAIVNITLKPTFGEIKIIADDSDEIFIDTKSIGKGNYSGKLLKGAHLIEAKKDKHYTESRNIDVVAGQTYDFEFKLKHKTSILSIMTNPPKADIFINGKKYGQSPRFISDILLGNHTLKIVMQGFDTLVKQIEIVEDKTTTVNENLTEIKKPEPEPEPIITGTKMISVTSDPSGAGIFVDGEKKGITPVLISLSMEEHSVVLQKEMYIDIKETITIDKNSGSFYFELIKGGKQSDTYLAEEHFQLQNRNHSPEKQPEIVLPEDIVQRNNRNNSPGNKHDMVLVEGGIFTIGCTDDKISCKPNEKPIDSIKVNSFYIGKYEVTQKQWRELMNEKETFYLICDDCPVVQVSWNEAQEFIKRLNARDDTHFRLPTEAEWEYAAKGGNKSKNYMYSGSNNIEDVAWYYSNAETEIHPVGTKKPNELGIYDMSGNVWEWCSNWYDENFAITNKDNPQGPSSGSYKAVRGGSLGSNATTCRTASRSGNIPGELNSISGFRLVKDVE